MERAMQNAIGFAELPCCDEPEDVYAEISATGAVEGATDRAPSILERLGGVNSASARTGDQHHRGGRGRREPALCEADFIGTQAEALWRLARMCQGTTSGEF
jgi:hypothetical protein